MNPRVTFDVSALRKALTSLAKETGEDKPELVNSTAKFVAINAYRATTAAGVQNIRDELGAPAGNSGLTLAEAIVLSRSRKSGQRLSGKGALKRAAKTLIGKRASSNMWLRAGFIPAIRAFDGRGGTNKFSRPPGRATKARKSRRPKAIIDHTDKGIREQFPTILPAAVAKQAKFLERLAAKKLAARIRRNGFK